ncbi:MAG: S24/S26 family peptidase [Methanobacteriaceae archaeon]|jgi:hypothetical protein|nr:S24/S26 family peptidase [Methanobacteriaceae archaeon]
MRHNLTKNQIIAIIGLFLIFILVLFFVLNNNYVEVHLDGENITTTIITALFIHDSETISNQINEYTMKTTNNDYDSNISNLKEGIRNITKKHGMNNADIVINSKYGENQIPILFTVNGTSMDPTLKDNQDIIILKTKDIHVGDIVVSNDSEYGIIVKRVSEINGTGIYLTSDNKEIETEYINGIEYKKEGIKTWNNLSDIIGIVKEY